MRIIEISALDNGAHRNQTGNFSVIPDGWAAVPDSITIPDTFPFVNIEVDNQIVVTMTAGTVPVIEPTIEDQIASLKAQLSSTDYKIIKCSEAQLLGEELPYDIVALHQERQALRDKINELEQQLEAENNQEGGAI